MRGLLILAALGLSGCGEHRGWNPNYQFGNDRYGQYLAAREAALITGERPAPTIAIARPILAPTAAQIAGQDPVPVPQTMGVRVLRPAPAP